jgi:hypothetical protein
MEFQTPSPHEEQDARVVIDYWLRRGVSVPEIERRLRAVTPTSDNRGFLSAALQMISR